MEFELSKCAKPTFKRGKLEKSDHVRLDGETMIKDLEQEKVYKYLGVDESIGIQQVIMKRKLKRELVKRTRVIRKTVPDITYSFNIIGWNLSEVKRLDIKIRNMTTTQNMHHPKADIHHLYLRISNGRSALTQLKLSYETSTIGLLRYLNLLDGNVLQLALNHEKEKGSRSVVKEAREFVREIGLDLEFDGEMQNTENARKLKRIAKKRKRRLSILLRSQNFYMVNTPFKTKKLM